MIKDSGFNVVEAYQERKIIRILVFQEPIR